jgi:phosphoserine phosphatase RsbU/P
MAVRESILKIQEENEKLRQSVKKLTTLNKIVITMCSANSLEQVLDFILHDSVEYINAEHGIVILSTEQGSSFHAITNREDNRKRNIVAKAGDRLAKWMAQNQKPLIINNLIEDDRLTEADKEMCRCDSLLCVPLKLEDGSLGIIALFNKKGNPGEFTEYDEDMLMFISGQSAQVIERFRLLDQENRLIKIDEEIYLAQRIQRDLFPEKAPQLEGYDLFSLAVPAKDVGGDYYDFISIDDTKTAICVADISGKGMGAALLMANLQATVRSQTMMTCSSKKCYHSAHLSTACFIDNCVERINSLLCNSTTPEKYATMFYGVLDTSTHQFVFTNAGNTQPILFRPDGNYMKLTDTGLPIGLFDGVKHESRQIQFNPGDMLLLYSDGVSESVNSNEDYYGEERLVDFVLKNPGLSPNELVEAIIGDVEAFAADTIQHDDITVMALRRQMPAE